MSKFFVLVSSLALALKVFGQTEIKNLSLNDAIEIGLQHNPEINVSLEKINAANGRFWSGISLPMPEVSVSYEYVPTSKSFENYGEKTLEFNQTLEFPTNYFLRGSIFSKEKEISEFEYKHSELSVISKIKSAYYSVLKIQEQLTIAKENISIAEDFNKKAEIRYNVGEGTNLEKLTAKVQYSEALNNVEVLKNNLLSVFEELNFVLGLERDQIKNYQLNDKLDNKKLDFTFEKLFDEAIKINPQLKVSELKVGASEVERTLAWSGLLPNFNLAYLKQSRDGDNSFYGVSFGIFVPLWFIFDQRGKIQEASANVSIAESDLQLTKNNIYLKIKNAFTQYENERKQVQFYETEILPQAEEIFRTASKSYEAGEITYIEYLQAKQTLINSRSNYINTLHSYNLSIINIEEAVGFRLY